MSSRNDRFHGQNATTLQERASGLAHELNAPLSTVLTNLDVVLERIGELDVAPSDVRPLVEALIEARAGVDQAAGKVAELRQLGVPGPRPADALPASQPHQAMRTKPPRRGRVLLADDDPMVRTALTRALGREHDLVVVDSGLQALHAIQDRQDWDVIVCDLMMPELSGRRLYEGLLRTHPELAQRLIFVTGGAYTADDQAFLDSLANPVLEKPFRIQRLRDLISAGVAMAG